MLSWMKACALVYRSGHSAIAIRPQVVFERTSPVVSPVMKDETADGGNVGHDPCAVIDSRQVTKVIVVSLTEIIDCLRHPERVGVEQKGYCIFGYVIRIDGCVVECLMQIFEQILHGIKLIFPFNTNQHEHGFRSGMLDDSLETWRWKICGSPKGKVFAEDTSFELTCNQSLTCGLTYTEWRRKLPDRL